MVQNNQQENWHSLLAYSDSLQKPAILDSNE